MAEGKGKTIFHKVTYAILRPPAKLAMRLVYNFHWKLAPEIEGPCFILANHNLDLDAMLVACNFKKLVYFVAGENMFRMGFLSKLVEFLCDPISRVKGSTDASTAIGILRRLKNGFNVCMFAEGNRSWNGVTGPIHPTTARLVKKSNATLVTYRIEGGYLTTPRWYRKTRKGRMDGYVVNTYSPEELKKMSVGEIEAAIVSDIYEDAFATQRIKKIRFRGKRLAERLETAYYICPSCGKIGTMKSRGDEFFCSCGFSMRFTEYGFFKGENLPFSTVFELDQWQEKQAIKISESEGDEALFLDKGQYLKKLGVRHRMIPVSEGDTALYRDRFVAAGTEFPLSAITKIDMHGRENLVFSTSEGSFEVRSNEIWCARKYMTMVRLLKDRQSRINESAG